jgi:hypothetical protein
MDLKTNTVNVATEILAELQRTQVVSLEELDEQIQDRIDEKARINFVPALNFLYLIGCLDYDINTDAVYFLRSPGANQ